VVSCHRVIEFGSSSLSYAIVFLFSNNPFIGIYGLMSFPFLVIVSVISLLNLSPYKPIEMNGFNGSMGGYG